MTSDFQYPDWSEYTILVAEDIDSNFTVLSALLQKTNIRILRAHNGEEAVATSLLNPSVRLILMDISMPGCDGIEALRQIRQQLPGKIVIAQTAHDFSSVIAGENFDAFLRKPIRRKQLFEVLSPYLS